MFRNFQYLDDFIFGTTTIYNNGNVQVELPGVDPAEVQLARKGDGFIYLSVSGKEIRKFPSGGRSPSATLRHGLLTISFSPEEAEIIPIATE
jgi:HSP20 family molecular chaperone IbpA